MPAAGGRSVRCPNPVRLADVRAALHETLPLDTPDCDGRVAAVAAILREGDEGAELLFIRRARRRGDPWSGHMAWPGGKREPGDATLLATAMRETREEIGLDLAADGEPIGRVREWRHAGRAPKGLRGVFPFVFALHASSGRPGVPAVRTSAEVQETVWIPLSYFTGWSSRPPWSLARRWLPEVPPAFRYEGRLIWGLTQWMLADLLRKAARAVAGDAAARTL